MPMKKSIRIAFLTHKNPHDRKSYSGTYYYMGQALIRNGFEVEFIGPLKPRQELIGKLINRISKIFLKRKFSFTHAPFVTRGYSRLAEDRMKNKNFDFI